jgi:hypothetical protein
MTSLTPLEPHRISERRNFVQNGSASEGPTSSPSTSRRPSVLTATAIIMATETILPVSRTGLCQPARAFSQLGIAIRHKSKKSHPGVLDGTAQTLREL